MTVEIRVAPKLLNVLFRINMRRGRKTRQLVLYKLKQELIEACQETIRLNTPPDRIVPAVRMLDVFGQPGSGFDFTPPSTTVRIET